MARTLPHSDLTLKSIPFKTGLAENSPHRAAVGNPASGIYTVKALLFTVNDRSPQ